jgi:Flp pilus assembly protein TadD
MINVFRGDYAAALEDASNALLLNPENSQAYALIGIAHGLLGDILI